MGNYDEVEKCTNIATVTSSLKLFLREMPQPLITKEIQNLISDSQIDWSAINDKLLISQLESIFMRIDHLSFCVLKYFLKHLKDVSETEGNNYNITLYMKYKYLIFHCYKNIYNDQTLFILQAIKWTLTTWQLLWHLYYSTLMIWPADDLV